MEDQRDHAEEAANAAAVQAENAAELAEPAVRVVQYAELRAQRFVITGEDRQVLQDAAVLLTGRLRQHVGDLFVWHLGRVAQRLQSAEQLAEPADGGTVADSIARELIRAEAMDRDVELLLAGGQTVRGIVVVDPGERPDAVAVYPWKLRPTERQPLPTIVRLSAIVAVVPID